MSLTYSEVRGNCKASSVVYSFCCRQVGNCSSLIYGLCTVSFSFDLYSSLIIIIQIKLLYIFTQAVEMCIITLSIIIINTKFFKIYLCRINLVIHYMGVNTCLLYILETKHSTISSCSNT